METERTQQLGLYVTPQEMQMARTLAKNAGMTKSAYIRFIIRQLYMYGQVTVDDKERSNENGNVRTNQECE